MDRLERDLRHGLRGVSAPPELWDRLNAARGNPPAAASTLTGDQGGAARFGNANPILVWALAASVAFIAAGLASIYRQSGAADEASALEALTGGSRSIGFHCSNPSQLRAWVRAKTGINLPLRTEQEASIELIGAQAIGGNRGVEIAYRAGNRDAVLLVSHVDSASPNSPHNRLASRVSSWVMDGQRYTLACADPAELQLACKLCHLD